MLDTVLLLLGRNTLWRGCHPWKKLKVLVTQLCLTLSDPVGCNLSGSSVHGILQYSYTGVGSHFLLQGIFPTQGLNPGLLHWRQILYRLSHQGSPESSPTFNLRALMNFKLRLVFCQVPPFSVLWVSCLQGPNVQRLSIHYKQCNNGRGRGSRVLSVHLFNPELEDNPVNRERLRAGNAEWNAAINTTENQ